MTWPAQLWYNTDVDDAEVAIRLAAMQWLDARASSRVDVDYLSGFEFRGERISLLDRQRGIRAPRQLRAALSIRTTFGRVGRAAPYEDEVGPDGFQRYKYRGTDPMHADNRKLRRAFDERLPLIWFVGVAEGWFEPIYPVWVIADSPERLEFTLAVDEAQRFLEPDSEDPDRRRYALRLTKQRLHQRVFRTQVLFAYQGRCCICRIRHDDLLDAAHIIEDGKPLGQAVTPNGLSLCKIHHAAFDAKLLGIRPDLTLHVRSDVLDEVDGWMLKGGIQEVHNRSLEVLPTLRRDHPDIVRLDERYSEFLTAS